MRALRAALEVELFKRSLRDYAGPAWMLMTGQSLRMNIAIDGLLTTLQAIEDGKLGPRNIIEVGPGLGKSTATTIAQTWELARDPRRRMIRGSHSYDLAARDSRRARRLVESDWWRARFAARLRDDENTAQRWTTVQDGAFMAVGVGSSLTGHRATSIQVDDGINALDYHSKAKREEVFTWFTEALMTRGDGNAPITVIGQRLGPADLQGRLRETGAWNVVTIPAEYDPKRRCFLFGLDGKEIWSDARTEEGELAAPDVLPRAKLDELRVGIGSAAYQSQYNQLVTSDETSMVPARWWRFYRTTTTPTGIRRPVGCDDSPAALLPDTFDHVVIGADLSYGGSAKADPSVVQAWGAKGGSRYLLRHWRQRSGGIDAQLAAIEGFADEFPGASIALEKAANGQAVADLLRKKHTGVLLFAPVGSKAQRLASQVPVIESGSCYLPEHANYTSDVIDEFRAFGCGGSTDDIVDCGVWCLYALSSSTWESPRPEPGCAITLGTIEKPAMPSLYSLLGGSGDTGGEWGW